MNIVTAYFSTDKDLKQVISFAKYREDHIIKNFVMNVPIINYDDSEYNWTVLECTILNEAGEKVAYKGVGFENKDLNLNDNDKQSNGLYKFMYSFKMGEFYAPQGTYTAIVKAFQNKEEVDSITLNLYVE